MEPMSNGDPTTARTPVTGPPSMPASGPGSTSSSAWSDPSGTWYPSGPPTAATPTPPTIPLGPPVSTTPPPYGAPVGAVAGGPGGPGSPGGWGGPVGPGAPQPTGRGGGHGRGVAIAFLLVFALLAGLAGGFGLAQLGRTSSDNSASGPVATAPDNPSGPSTTEPASPSVPGFDEQQGNGSSDPQATTPSSPVDADKVRDAVAPGVVNINVLTAGGQGAGTGMILTADGLVLTNNHVVRGATRIVVVDADTGDRYEAKVLGTAPTKDVALIRLVGAKGLDTVKTGNSDNVKVGDGVVALGNAGGQGGTPKVVAGSVVALGRSITASDQSGQESQRLSNLIQTDANIVPGDSGGPLADAKGEVIAVNAAASVTNQTSATGEGYAIPINDALRIVEKIKAGQASDVVHIGTRGVLGVQVTSVTADDPFADPSSGQAVAGASVAGVAEGSGAAKAGVAAGSTITSLEGRTITSAEALTNALANAKPGDKVTLGWTDAAGRSHTGTVVLTEGPPD